ncbi:MAG: alkaline phosphatase family protein [Vicinamibacteria bacterium]
MRIAAGAGLLATVFVAASFPSTQEPPSRVILFVWDGAAQWVATRLLEEGGLPNLQRIVREGAWSDGMITSFPTKTAAAHAVFWTGVYGYASGITANSVLLSPPADHTLLEWESGYFSHPLRVEPIWVRTARAGLMTYTFHASQSYPFEKSLEPLSPEERRNLRMLYGYSGLRVTPDVMTEERVPPSPAVSWGIPEATGPEAREITFRVGDQLFWGVFFDDPFDPAIGCDTLGVVEDKLDTEFEARVKPGEAASFSAPISTTLQGEELWFALRLFDLDATASRFVMYRSSAEAVQASSEDFPGLGETDIEAFAGNAGAAFYETQRFGPTLMAGGDGTAEKRFIETEAHLQDQIRRQVERVLRERDYRLLAMYSPVTDDVSHSLVGYVDPEMPRFDGVLAAKVWPTLAASFELQDRLLGQVMEHAARDGAHVIVVADHGMAGTDRFLNVNVALAHAGLLELNADGAIDLSRTRALAPPLGDGSVAVNSVEHKGGIVPVAEKRAVLAEVRRVLEQIHDPESGEPVVTAFFDPSTEGLLQPGGSSTGDLFMDLARGYHFSDRIDTDDVVSFTTPTGNHIFVPTRRDMLAICAGWGSRVPPGTRWSRVRAIDIAPTLLDVLGLPKPPELPGRSLIPEDTIVH